MNSLKIKILALVTTIMLTAVGLTAWHNLKTQKAMLNQLASQSSRILSETIRNSIINDMASGESDAVAHILAKIKKEPAIAAVRIIDESGRILLSADPEEAGDLVDATDLLAYRAGRYSFTHETLDQSYHNTVLPIYNAPACHSCHQAEQRVLGILNVHVSLNDLLFLQQKGREATLVSSAGMIVFLVLGITCFILVYVDAPLRKLSAAMTHVERGEFDLAHTSIRSSDEMADLGAKFNLMVDRLKGLITDTVTSEKELALKQKQLEHHKKIHEMNQTLEERLMEIEHLNTSLEERIEEIEEANYKIADLAGDLEAKNTTLEQAVSRLSALYKMGLAVNSTMNLEKLFDLLIRKTMGTLGARTGYILLVDRERAALKVGAAIGLPKANTPGARIPLRPGGVSHWVIDHGQPLLITDIDQAEGFSKVSRLGITRETLICAPLVVGGEAIGTLTMANRLDNGTYTTEDLELLATIATQAAIAIRNAHHYEEQQASYMNTVQALVSAVEASDAYTHGHSERVTRYSLALARHLNLSPKRMQHLEKAAILHDIGKIGIDVALLHKPGKLTDDDIATLQQHPSIGVKILAPIQFLTPVRDIIEHHHERFDGKGYPYGKAGEEIPLEARILSVADTYDAMTSSRPYRKALAHETAITEIRDHAGTQFDPVIAQAFITMLDSGDTPSHPAPEAASGPA